ncbi:unnamed protein product [Mytilus coruscus]|uniref:EGF-like domain-containing protein n=1 Tax=Mytilus coruscus TaxID=42192 RepID=A0A6J8BMU2_MYTCO|nr:unnamed protein product [Mytilus coruscus]
MVFVICIAVDAEGVAYGDACTGDGSNAGDCTETTNIVCDTTCKCTTDSFRKGGTECATRIAYGDACTGGGSGDCTEKTNIVCDTTCKCSPSTFRKTTATECAAQIGFEQCCEATQTASDQCSVPETECKDDAGTKKCMCKATYYSDGRACQTRIKPNIACTAAGQCVTHATCDTTDTDTCVCDAGYTPSPTISPSMYMMKRYVIKLLVTRDLITDMTENLSAFKPQLQVEEVDIPMAVVTRPRALLLSRLIYCDQPSTVLHSRGNQKGQGGKEEQQRERQN